MGELRDRDRPHRALVAAWHDRGRFDPRSVWARIHCADDLLRDSGRRQGVRGRSVLARHGHAEGHRQAADRKSLRTHGGAVMGTRLITSTTLLAMCAGIAWVWTGLAPAANRSAPLVSARAKPVAILTV